MEELGIRGKLTPGAYPHLLVPLQHYGYMIYIYFKIGDIHHLYADFGVILKKTECCLCLYNINYLRKTMVLCSKLFPCGYEF